MADVSPIVNALYDFGTYLLIVAFILGSGRWMLYFASDVHQNWGRWDTFPIPDRRATKNLLYLLLILAADSLFAAFTLWWFLG